MEVRLCCYPAPSSARKKQPDLDYLEVSPELQRIRGPYPISAGITAYVEHAERHPSPQAI